MGENKHMALPARFKSSLARGIIVIGNRLIGTHSQYSTVHLSRLYAPQSCRLHPQHEK